MSIDQTININIGRTVNDSGLYVRRGYQTRIPQTVRNSLESKHYTRINTLQSRDAVSTSYCDGHCGTDSDGSGVCYCDD